MISAVEFFLVNELGARLAVFLCSMLPVIELRGGIPLGMVLGLPWWQSFLFAVIGNMLPVPLILLFVERVIAWMSRSRVKLFCKFGNFLLQKAEKNRGKIKKYSFFGICLFVAVPFPATGAWTGALVAAGVGMKPQKALLSCLLGILIAAVIVTLISYGALAAFQFLL